MMAEAYDIYDIAGWLSQALQLRHWIEGGWRQSEVG